MAPLWSCMGGADRPAAVARRGDRGADDPRGVIGSWVTARAVLHAAVFQ